jgi:transposase
MYKYNQIFGVDISKDVFDVMSSQGEHLLLENSSNGFNQLTKHLTKKDLIVMEATDYYHYYLAQYLYDLGYIVSVVNPLAVKRFVQMKLSKIKTDKSDALAICQYASSYEVHLYFQKFKSSFCCSRISITL